MRPFRPFALALLIAVPAAATGEYQQTYLRDLNAGGYTSGCVVQLSSGEFTCAVSPSAGAGEPYVTVGNTGGLSAERAITAGTCMSASDGGANGPYTLNVTCAPALSANGTNCSAGDYSRGADASGNAEGCTTVYYQFVGDEGTALTQRGKLNFAGAGVTCADDGTDTTCTIAGGSGAGASEPFLTVSNSAGLSAERAIAAGAGLTGTDGGANGSYALEVGAGSCITVNADDVALAASCSQDQAWSGKHSFSNVVSFVPDATDMGCAAGVCVVHDWSPPSVTNAIAAWSGSGAQVVLTGIVPGKYGRLLILVNGNTNPSETLTLLHENAGSSDGNRIWLPGQASGLAVTNTLVVAPGESVTLKYEFTTRSFSGVDTASLGVGRWFVVAQSYASDRFWNDPPDCAAGTLPRGVDQTGAAAGCAAVALASEVAGALPEANGGTGSSKGATVTLGPFYINDLPGTATTQATLGFFNTATALSRSANDVKIQAAARVVGLYLVSDAARTAGTATARVRVNGTGQTFNGGSVALDATNTTSDSGMVTHSAGVAVSSAQTVGCDVVTSGWTPTTADLSCWIVVSYD